MATQKGDASSAADPAVPESPKSEEEEDWKMMLAGAQERFESEIGKIKTEVVDLKQTIAAQKKEEHEKVDKRAEEKKEEKEEEDKKKEKEKTERAEIKDAVEALKIEVDILRNFQKATTFEEDQMTKEIARTVALKVVIFEEELKKVKSDSLELWENLKNAAEKVEVQIQKGTEVEEYLNKTANMMSEKNDQVSKDLKRAYESVDKLKELETRVDTVDILVQAHEDAIVTAQESASISTASSLEAANTVDQMKQWIKDTTYDHKKIELKIDTKVENMQKDIKITFEKLEKKCLRIKEKVWRPMAAEYAK